MPIGWREELNFKEEIEVLAIEIIFGSLETLD
jgi:hypothetical protein